MDSFTAVMIAEGTQEASEAEQKQAWQYLVDTGLAWRLQGWFGRTAAHYIRHGHIQAAGAPRAWLYLALA